MDWTKAKSILIVALVVTNLVVLATYFLQNSRFQTDEKEMQDVTVKLLEEKNIFIRTDIPEEHPRIAKLTVQYDKMNENVIKGRLADQKALPEGERTDENLISATTELIEKSSLMTPNVVFGSIVRKEDEILVTYNNYIDEIAIEPSEISCTVKDGRITELNRYWLDPVEVSSTEKEVIPALAALIKFMSENKDEERIYVEDISLVYWLDSSMFDAESPVTDTAFPAWKITYNQGKIKYIIAWEQ